MKIKDLKDKVKHSIYQDAPETESTVATLPSHSEDKSSTYLPPISVSTSSDVGMVTTGDVIYNGVMAKTNPDNCPNLKEVLSLAKPLEKVITDPALRMRGALAQAVDKGISPEAINRDLVELRQRLDDEHKRANARIEDVKKNFIDGAEEKAAAIQKEIDQKHEEMSNIRLSAERSRSQVAAMSAQVEAAIARRSSELDQLANQFRSY